MLSQAPEQLQKLSEKVEALEHAVAALQDAAPLGPWDWVVRVASVLAVTLAILRIRDHFANRARVHVDVSSARFKPSYTHKKGRTGWYPVPLEGIPAGLEEVQINTSIEIALELRNVGRASTTLSGVTLETKHALIGTQEMRGRKKDLLLGAMDTCRIDPNDVQRVTVHAVLDSAPEEASIRGKLLLTFAHGNKRCAVTLARRSA